MSDPRFIRTEALLGTAAMETLASSHVAVFGLGGVGSWAAEALARSGVGTLTLVDFDTVGESNVNRQVIAMTSTLGLPKAEVMAARARDINPGVDARARVARYSAETRDALLGTAYDYLIDAIDLVSCKLDLIEAAGARGIPLISCLGTGNRLDGTAFRVTDIAGTRDDPLARVMRRELRRRGISHCRVLWAPGGARKPASTGEAPPPGRRSIPGSVSWAPSAAGLCLAGFVVQALLAGASDPLS